MSRKNHISAQAKQLRPLLDEIIQKIRPELGKEGCMALAHAVFRKVLQQKMKMRGRLINYDLDILIWKACYDLLQSVDDGRKISIVLPEGLESVKWAHLAFKDCYMVETIVIPDSVASIGKAAFAECSGLTSVVIPAGVTSIGDEAFAWCSGLTSVVIPAGVTRIGSQAFAWCSGLTGNLVIPDSVTTIGSHAFYGCSGLRSVKCGNPALLMGVSIRNNGVDMWDENTAIYDKVRCIAASSGVSDLGMWGKVMFMMGAVRVHS